MPRQDFLSEVGPHLITFFFAFAGWWLNTEIGTVSGRPYLELKKTPEVVPGAEHGFVFEFKNYSRAQVYENLSFEIRLDEEGAFDERDPISNPPVLDPEEPSEQERSLQVIKLRMLAPGQVAKYRVGYSGSEAIEIVLAEAGTPVHVAMAEECNAGLFLTKYRVLVLGGIVVLWAALLLWWYSRPRDRGWLVKDSSGNVLFTAEGAAAFEASSAETADSGESNGTAEEHSNE